MLKDYLDQTKESQASFATRISSTPATVSRLVAGTLKPSLDLAFAIEKATEGRVPMSAWAGFKPDRAARLAECRA